MEQDLPKKLVVGWFSFTCCEGCLIFLTELLNKNFDNWKKLIEFRHVKALKRNNSLENLDIAFVEGAISSDKQAQKLQKIRDNSKYVVAIGACATTGRPSATRNDLDKKDFDYKMLWSFENFDYADKVRKISEVIKVDAEVPGCPMNGELFIAAVEKFLKLYNLI